MKRILILTVLLLASGLVFAQSNSAEKHDFLNMVCFH